MNQNWILKKDGYHKKPDSVTRGNADYFSKPLPPVRDGQTGHPIKNGEVDWKRVIEEVNRAAKLIVRAHAVLFVIIVLVTLIWK